MGNFCCTEEITRGSRCEEYHIDIELTVSPPITNPLFLNSHLDTVKEEAVECSEQSDYLSMSRSPRQDY